MSKNLLTQVINFPKVAYSLSRLIKTWYFPTPSVLQPTVSDLQVSFTKGKDFLKNTLLPRNNWIKPEFLGIQNTKYYKAVTGILLITPKNNSNFLHSSY